MRSSRRKRLEEYKKSIASRSGSNTMYLKKSQPRNRVSLLSVWGEINLAKRLVFASIMFGMIFVPMFNTPQAYAGLDITSQYFDEGDYLTTSPVGTASVKTEIETYIAQEGDTIGSLANKFNISSFTMRLFFIKMVWNQKIHW